MVVSKITDEVESRRSFVLLKFSLVCPIFCLLSSNLSTFCFSRFLICLGWVKPMLWFYNRIHKKHKWKQRSIPPEIIRTDRFVTKCSVPEVSEIVTPSEYSACIKTPLF